MNKALEIKPNRGPTVYQARTFMISVLKIYVGHRKYLCPEASFQFSRTGSENSTQMHTYYTPVGPRAGSRSTLAYKSHVTPPQSELSLTLYSGLTLRGDLAVPCILSSSCFSGPGPLHLFEETPGVPLSDTDSFFDLDGAFTASWC